jgi:CDP-diacylglycerol--glycerol-3-phosphate 3-phosphatidyltransferase
MKLSLWTWPNLLTISRLFLLWPILWSMSQGRTVLVCSFIAIAIITDIFDGYLARRLDKKSNAGKILDPIVDKAAVLGVVLFMLVSPDYQFPLWFFLFLLLRELGILLCSLYVLIRYKPIMESIRSGKNSAFVTGLAIFLFAIKLQPFGWILLWLALILTLYSSWQYLRLFLKHVKSD